VVELSDDESHDIHDGLKLFKLEVRMFQSFTVFVGSVIDYVLMHTSVDYQQMLENT
jgi:hypothetical protein